jgi:di/tricarboxylate transporter
MAILSGEAIFVLAVTAAALALFVSELVPADIVALIALAALGLGGVLEPAALAGGFGSPVILTLIGLFMLTAALEHTGVTAYLSQLILRLTRGASERRIVGLVALGAGIASLLMNTVASAALITPVARSIAHRRDLSPSRLLMPVAFGALLGGMATLLTTSNLLVASFLTERGLPSFRLLSFLPVGGPIALLGILYLTIFSPLLLPERSPSDQWSAIRQARIDLTQTYRLSKRLFEGQISPRSPLAGKKLSESDLGSRYGVTVAAVVRGKQRFAPPDASMSLQAEDWLLLEGRPDDIASCVIDLELAVSDPDEQLDGSLFASNSELAEVVLSPRSMVTGHTLEEIHFREKFGLNVLGVWHEGRPYRSHLARRQLEMGDALLVQGPPDRLSILSKDADFLVLTRLPPIPAHSGRVLVAVSILAVFLVVVASGVLPIALAALIGAIAVVVTGCETVEQARSSIRWQVLFLIGGMAPLATALEQTGVIALAADFLLQTVGTLGPHALLLTFFLFTIVLSQLTSGPAATLVIGPLAIATALNNQLSPQAFAMVVAIGASTAFLSPVGHPANLLVMGPGGYRFRDYMKLGFPLVIIAGLGIILILPLVYPL